MGHISNEKLHEINERTTFFEILKVRPVIWVPEVKDHFFSQRLEEITELKGLHFQ